MPQNRFAVPVFALAASCAAAPAYAQESAVRSAGDAFGERRGVEQVGLYGEGQVRGFNLQNSGAYRIDGAYFARQMPISDAALDGVGVRVGVNAARLEFPSPSGVVNYRLRDTTGDSRWHATVGLRDYETPVLDLGGVWVSADDEVGVSANLIARPNITWAMGNGGSIYEFGAVARWTPSGAFQLRGLLSVAERDYNGDYGVSSVDGALPPPIKRLQNYSPPWAEVISPQVTAGVLADGRQGDWSWGASAFRASWTPGVSDATLLRVEADGDAQATLFRTPDREFVSDAVEARAARVFDGKTVDHRIGVSARVRRSRAQNALGTAVPLGTVNIQETPTYPGEPVVEDDGRRILDDVDQTTLSASYGLMFGEALGLRLGAHRTRYEKAVTPIGGTRTARAEDLWLYNASALWNLSDRTTLFASWVTGLEETGTAPQKATNRNEILAPVEAEQVEFGARHALTGRLNLIGAVFEVSKPKVGFRADGSYGLVGEVSHRGVEASLSGQVLEGTSVVLGAVLLDPEVSGPLVDAGSVGPVPPGVSEMVAVASVDHRLTFAPAWSVDATVNFSGESWADTANTFQREDRAMVDLGVRYRFKAGDADALFRAVLVNAFDERGWWTNAEELLFPVAPRTFRASLTLRFYG
ncbi:MAG TPA: TonB-dependent receptor [Caulobacteraceae bacterium]|nr:TonB-dependent receptor [Caulobacteraceae bacterium]